MARTEEDKKEILDAIKRGMLCFPPSQGLAVLAYFTAKFGGDLDGVRRLAAEVSDPVLKERMLELLGE